MLRRSPAPLLAVLTAAALSAAAPAQARIGASVTIDGPAPEILELGGAAFASDGTGGLVYRRFEGGRSRIFAARYVDGRWMSAGRVDVGQQFDSTWPRIAASRGGRLVVVWTQDGGANDRLFSAVLPRGARGFMAPTLIDFRIGEASATFPSLAVTDAGDGLLSYRVITAPVGTSGFPPGFAQAEIRLARFNGTRWSRIGVPANRNRAQVVREPTAANSPKVAVAADGGGIVAFTEPDDELIDRVWARRIFGSRVGPIQRASAIEAGGRPLRGGADAVAVAASRLGRVLVAYRQQPDPRSIRDGPRIMTNELDEVGSLRAGVFGDPVAADAARPAGPVGPPTAAIHERTRIVGVGTGNGAAGLLRAVDETPFGLDVLAGDATPEPATAVAAGIAGHVIAAWRSPLAGGVVGVQERVGDRVLARAVLAGAAGGPVGDLVAVGNRGGDGIVAFSQGSSEQRQIVAAAVDGPPAPFTLTLSPGWVRDRSPHLTWEGSLDSRSAVDYVVNVDGRNVARTRQTSIRLKEGSLRDGPHRVRVSAFDQAGQTVATDLGVYRLDRRAPEATATVRGRRATVRIRDALSGPAEESSSITWGDGEESLEVSGRAVHTYRRAGRYRIDVRAVDEAGNVERQAIDVVVRGPASGS